MVAFCWGKFAWPARKHEELFAFRLSPRSLPHLDKMAELKLWVCEVFIFQVIVGTAVLFGLKILFNEFLNLFFQGTYCAFFDRVWGANCSQFSLRRSGTKTWRSQETANSERQCVIRVSVTNLALFHLCMYLFHCALLLKALFLERKVDLWINLNCL